MYLSRYFCMGSLCLCLSLSPPLLDLLRHPSSSSIIVHRPCLRLPNTLASPYSVSVPCPLSSVPLIHRGPCRIPYSHSHSHPQSQYPTPPLSPMFPTPLAHPAQLQQTQPIPQHQGLFSMHDATESSSTSPADPIAAATSSDSLSRPSLSPRKPRFSMGPRADCEKCRRREPGHWVHLD